jgi:hypothetical protein
MVFMEVSSMSRNQKGEGILNFALAYDLIIVNTLFRKSLSSNNF